MLAIVINVIITEVIIIRSRIPAFFVIPPQTLPQCCIDVGCGRCRCLVRKLAFIILPPPTAPSPTPLLLLGLRWRRASFIVDIRPKLIDLIGLVCPVSAGRRTVKIAHVLLLNDGSISCPS